MKHLTDEQLSGLLDDALDPRARSAAETHLAGCDACRARLAEASALERSLGSALTHDAGDAYFADFAERVARRIADAPAPGTRAAAETPTPARPRSLWGWLLSPRGLTFAGSAAVLVLTAGVAWLRFHDEAVAPHALRAASPERFTPPQASAPQSQASPPAASAPTTGAPSEARRADELDRSEAPSASRENRVRAQRVEPRADREVVLRDDQHLVSPPTVPPTGSALGLMKQRAIAPAKDERGPETRNETRPVASGGASAAPSGAAPPSPSPPEAPLQARAQAKPQAEAQAKRPPSNNWGALKSLYDAPRPAAAKLAPPAQGAVTPPTAAEEQVARRVTAPGPAADSLRNWSAFSTGEHLRDARPGDLRILSGGDGDALSPCGIVHDVRGHAIAGAQVTAVHDGVRSARTGRDGRFCFDALRIGDTLSVLRVGYVPVQVVVGPGSSLAFALEPVPTLGSGSRFGFSERVPPPAGAAPGVADQAPAPDPYAGLAPDVRAAVADAREAAAVARRERTATAFEHAAVLWAAVAERVPPASAYDARFQSLTVMREACRLEPTPDRVARFRSELEAFVTGSPRTLPERATALRWQTEFKGAAYR